MMTVTDAHTQFLYNAYIYSGKSFYLKGPSASEKKTRQTNTVGPKISETYWRITQKRYR